MSMHKDINTNEHNSLISDLQGTRYIRPFAQVPCFKDVQDAYPYPSLRY